MPGHQTQTHQKRNFDLAADSHEQRAFTMVNKQHAKQDKQPPHGQYAYSNLM